MDGRDLAMDRVFWVRCPQCSKRFICDYELRHAGVRLECPFCQGAFLPEESPELDERWFS
jgi:hypothetical protein